VQQPAIAESVDRDVLELASWTRVAKTRTVGADHGVADLADEPADRLREELDLRRLVRIATIQRGDLQAEVGHAPRHPGRPNSRDGLT